MSSHFYVSIHVIPLPLMFPACPLLYLVKYYLLLSYWLVHTSSDVPKVKMDQVLEKRLSFQH